MDLSVCVAVPCAGSHTQHLKGLLSSVQAQTVLPQKTAISVSAITEEECGTLKENLLACFPKCMPEVTCMTQGATAAENRNRAASVCAEVTSSPSWTPTTTCTKTG